LSFPVPFLVSYRAYRFKVRSHYSDPSIRLSRVYGRVDTAVKKILTVQTAVLLDISGVRGGPPSTATDGDGQPGSTA